MLLTPVCEVGQIIKLAFVIKTADTSAKIRVDEAPECCVFIRSVKVLCF